MKEGRMKRVDRQPETKPVEPYAGGDDTNRTESDAPTSPPKSKGRRTEARGRQPVDTTTAESKPRPADEWFDNDRSDRSSGRPVQLPDEESGTAPGKPESGADREARQDRPPTGAPLKR
jgi:hypothetical protein